MARTQQGKAPTKKTPAKKTAEKPDLELPPEPGEPEPPSTRDQVERWIGELEDAPATEFGIVEFSVSVRPHPTLVLAMIVAMLGDQGAAIVSQAQDRVFNECLLLEREAR